MSSLDSVSSCGSLLTAVAPLVLCSTPTRARIIPSHLLGLHRRDCVFWLVEFHRPCGLSHSGGVFVNVGIFFRSRCRNVDCERLRSVVGSIGTNLCHDANDVRGSEGQRSCAGLVIHLGPVNLVVVLLKPNEERLADGGQDKLASGMLVQGLAKVGQHLG